MVSDPGTDEETLLSGAEPKRSVEDVHKSRWCGGRVTVKQEFGSTR